jgi:predicted lipid carrier protein YhbT
VWPGSGGQRASTLCVYDSLVVPLEVWYLSKIKVRLELAEPGAWVRVLTEERGMSDATEQFFQELAERGYEPLVAKFSGRVRFDVVDGDRTDRWFVTINKGDIAVSRHGGDGECAIRADKALFDRLARGEENAMAAALRGGLVCTGDVELLLAVQRVFPGPPRGSVRTAGSRSR